MKKPNARDVSAAVLVIVALVANLIAPEQISDLPPEVLSSLLIVLTYLLGSISFLDSKGDKK